MPDRDNKPLYGKGESECLAVRETMRDDEQKYQLLLDRLDGCRRLLDVGAGWGQFLDLAADHVSELWAVDESPDRVTDITKRCPQAKVVICRADHMDLPSDYFDVVVTSQMLHEVKLFGRDGDMERTLGEIHRVLGPSGRYLLLDHRDSGPGEVTVQLPPDQMAKLCDFERKYQFYDATHADLGSGKVRISRRSLQDFLTKDWSLGSSMEQIEMNETHNVFAEADTRRLLTAAGFDVLEWLEFLDIGIELQRHGGQLIEGKPWHRKFLLVAQRTP